jgi:NitT/TauT family transport system substrate-binding protein
MREDDMLTRRRFSQLGAAAMGTVAMPAIAQTPTKVMLGVPNAATDVGYFVAHSRGYFREEGLDVEILPFPSAARMIAPMASGELHTAAGGPSAGLYNAITRGIDIRMVSDKSKNTVGRSSIKVVVRKALVDSGRVKTIADLKGLKYANGAPGSSATSGFHLLFKKAGIRPDEVTEVSMSFPQQVQALETGAIDFAMPPDPAGTLAIKRGTVVKLMDGWELIPSHQVAVTLYEGRFAAQRAEEGRRFMRAFLRGVRDHNDALDDQGNFEGARGDAIIDILVKYGPFKDPAIYKAFTLAYCDPDGTLDMKSLQDDIDIFQELKMLERPVDLKKVVDNSFRDWALQQLGPYKKKT